MEEDISYKYLISCMAIEFGIYELTGYRVMRNLTISCEYYDLMKSCPE